MTSAKDFLSPIGGKISTISVASVLHKTRPQAAVVGFRLFWHRSVPNKTILWLDLWKVWWVGAVEMGCRHP
jgi:hypothetical protein